MAVYVLGDTHFGHDNMVLKYSRQHFSSIEEHDRTIVDNILSVCGKRDTLYLMGDVCLKKDAFHYVEEIAKAVENLYIVLGNHDFERKEGPTLMDYIELQKYARIKLLGISKYKDAWLSHAPIHPSELRGEINIHGHIHDKAIDDERYVNISCENIDYTPVNIKNILEKANR